MQTGRHHSRTTAAAAAAAAGRRRGRRKCAAVLLLFAGLLLLLSFVLLVLLLTVAIAAAAVDTMPSNSAGPITTSIGTTLQRNDPAVPMLIPAANQQQQQHKLKLLPLCVGNLLDRRAYDGIGGGDVLSRRLLLPPKNRADGPAAGITQSAEEHQEQQQQQQQQQQHCRLMSYTAQPIATCLDALFIHQQQQQQQQQLADQAAANSNSSSSPSSSTALPVPPPAGELLFVFMGDSRIRQQFLNFVKIIPNYDRVTVPSSIPPKYHGDIEMSSRLLRLRVSFKWRPLVNDNLIRTLDDIRQTAASDPRRRPQFILLSMAAWHMLREHGADIALYQRRMTQLGPILASMSMSMSGQQQHCGRIIWLRQYTSVDSYGDNGKSNTLVVADKLRHYNRIALRRLVLIQTDEAAAADSGGGGGGGGVYLWDSSDPLADEYVRSCAILKRYEHSSDKSKDYATAYANCNDYVHTGYSALSQATQLLFNDLCNAHLMQSSS
ncbi:hypothetical protein DAPPUDRAFT_101790 [Daphnia pulex]|uniref:Uncharacterized protein n=1 Tax=Daphnia pulex TaxID=6669 RepID=E9GEK2_DAPPU|nr:hypothetical protein DAPPUDRAFT_101790 [Daphnia pulex]|eukprot:EFX82297.1 hypothetical protein DAPPUDRAFT_101790 [Daphnia pulex]